MNTPAHLLLAAAIAAKPGVPSRNWAMAAGALVPDLMMFVMVGWERWINGRSMERIFRESYYSDHWQQIFAICNSIPVYAVLLVVGLSLRMEWLWVFGLCALAHVVLDLPLHHDDGHPHFWPVSDWIYASPVSYWDPGHHGAAFGMLEAAFSSVLAVLLLVRFRGWFARLLIVAALAIELLFSVGSHLIYGGM